MKSCEKFGREIKEGYILNSTKFWNMVKNKREIREHKNRAKNRKSRKDNIEAEMISREERRPIYGCGRFLEEHGKKNRY